MNWKIRHEGSPEHVEGLSLQQILEGLRDGLWEPTDEVMGPQDRDWVAIENHPQLAEAAADIEPPPPRVYDDETRLDMTALIDVTLVLLIFFILTTTYAALQKQMEAPGMTEEDVEKKAVVVKEEILNQVIYVTAKMEDGKPVVRVENKVVNLATIENDLKSFRKRKSARMLVEYDADVPWETVVAILDASKGAGIERVLFPTSTN